MTRELPRTEMSRRAEVCSERLPDQLFTFIFCLRISAKRFNFPYIACVRISQSKKKTGKAKTYVIFLNNSYTRLEIKQTDNLIKLDFGGRNFRICQRPSAHQVEELVIYLK